MKKGILYGVGVGPGDPELLTLKAQRVLREADVIAVPDKGAGEKTALRIIGDLAEGKELLFCPAPMIRDQGALDEARDKIAGNLAALLEKGKTVVFITLGDPTVYSTYLYIHRRVLAKGYEAEIVPGVPSFCAAAAALGESLCEGSERLLIVPASHKDVSDCLATDANLLFMKAGRELGALREALDGKGLLERASLVENCGMEGERVCPRFADAPAESGYFTVVLVKRDGNKRFPLFIDLTGRTAVVVGGGTVGLRRAKVLRDFGAAVTVISPELSSDAPGIRHMARAYKTGDLSGAFLALAATDDSTVNAAVEAEARALGVLFNRSDSPEACDFFFPAICEGEAWWQGWWETAVTIKKTAQTAKAIRAVMEQN